MKPGGILDSWLGIINDMSDKIENIQITDSKKPRLDVSYNMEFRQDIPRFVGNKNPKTGGRF